MKKNIVILWSVCLAVITLGLDAADPYQAFLQRDQAYARQNAAIEKLRTELDQLGKSLFPGYFHITPDAIKDAAAAAKAKEVMIAVGKSPEYRKLALEYARNEIELMSLENKICAQVNDPATVAILKQHFLHELPSPGNADSAPKKQVSGSPAFQHAMYVIDKIREEDAARQKWPTVHALIWLSQNLKRDAFDDDDYRRAHYQTQISQLATMTKRMEIQQANPEFSRQLALAQAEIDDNKPETRKNFEKYFTALQQAINSDPDYQRLDEAWKQASQDEQKELEKFAAKSELPSAVEYRTFKTALEQLDK